MFISKYIVLDQDATEVYLNKWRQELRIFILDIMTYDFRNPTNNRTLRLSIRINTIFVNLTVDKIMFNTQFL